MWWGCARIHTGPPRNQFQFRICWDAEGGEAGGCPAPTVCSLRAGWAICPLYLLQKTQFELVYFNLWCHTFPGKDAFLPPSIMHPPRWFPVYPVWGSNEARPRLLPILSGIRCQVKASFYCIVSKTPLPTQPQMCQSSHPWISTTTLLCLEV